MLLLERLYRQQHYFGALFRRLSLAMALSISLAVNELFLNATRATERAASSLSWGESTDNTNSSGPIVFFVRDFTLLSSLAHFSFNELIMHINILFYRLLSILASINSAVRRPVASQP